MTMQAAVGVWDPTVTREVELWIEAAVRSGSMCGSPSMAPTAVNSLEVGNLGRRKDGSERRLDNPSTLTVPFKIGELEQKRIVKTKRADFLEEVDQAEAFGCVGTSSISSYRHLNTASQP